MSVDESNVKDLMDAMEERAETNLQLLSVLGSAQMMRVTREAIINWIEDERRRERRWFQALCREPDVAMR